MKSRLAILLLLAGLPLAAQSWDTLRGLKPGDPIEVTDTAGHGYKGQLTSVSADSIAVATSKGEQSIERSRVEKVQLRKKAHRVRNAVIGLGIGTASGLTIDQTLGVRLRNEGADSYRAATIALPMVIFTGIGAAIPGGTQTVYRR